LAIIRTGNGKVRARYQGMSTKTINSIDPKVHSAGIQHKLEDLVEYVRRDIDNLSEPRLEALLETTAEVLIGLETAFRDYGEGKEKAWKR
jgi:hypothetical protein